MTRHSLRALFFLLCLSFCSAALQAQIATKAAGDTSLLPGPEPPDVPMEWKQLVGIYGHDRNKQMGQTVILFEKDQRLFLQPRGAPEKTQEIHAAGGSVLITEPDGRTQAYMERRTEDGTVQSFWQSETWDQNRMENSASARFPYIREDAGADPSHYYHIPLVVPVSELRQKVLAAQPPVEPGPFRKADLVELAPLDSAIHLDIRYAQSDNFLGTPLYTQARAFLQRPAAEALLRVLHKLQPLGYGLLIHDGYRPWYVTKIFWDATPSEDHNFVADPQKGSRHNRGCAVDLTLYDLATGKPVEMPGLYDEMSPRSFPDFPGGTSLQRWHRDLLRRAMESGGFTVNEDEWWHFDYKDWKHYPILNVPFEKLHGVAGAT